MKKIFFVIGGQKCGTSYLYNLLLQNPAIFSPVKEPHFFSKDEFYTHGKDYYESIFDGHSSAQILGDFSTTYYQRKINVSRILNYYPECKIIFLIREPVSRFISHVINDISAEKLFADNIPNSIFEENSSYVQNSLYYDKLVFYNSIGLTKKNLLVVKFHDLINDPSLVLLKINNFLELDYFIYSNLKKKVNVSRIYRFQALENILRTIAHQMQYIGLSRLRYLLRNTGLTEKIRTLNSDSSFTIKLRDEISLKMSDSLKSYLLMDWHKACDYTSNEN